MIKINKDDDNELKIAEINNKLEYCFINLNDHEACFNELKRKLHEVENLNNNLLNKYHDLESNFLNLKGHYDILYKIVSENYPDDIKLYLELADKKEIS